MYRPRIQQKQILAGTLTRTFNLNRGSDYPEHVFVILSISAMSAGETLDITGKAPGQATYLTAIVTAQIDLKANDSDVIMLDLSPGIQPTDGVATIVPPLDELLFTASAGVTAAETVDITLITW